MAVNLTAWTFNDRFAGFTHWRPFIGGFTYNSPTCTSSNVELNEPLALNPPINGQPSRSISFVAIYCDIAANSCCMMKWRQKNIYRAKEKRKTAQIANKEDFTEINGN